MSVEPHEGQAPSVRSEVESVLELDETRLGDVYRMTVEGLSPVEMAARLEIPSVGFAYSYRQQLDAILDGKLPISAHIAAQSAGRVRKWLKQKAWTDPAIQHLEAVLSGLENVAGDSQRVQREEDEAVQQTKAVESLGIAGIYVYTLPHYLRHPYDADTGHTLFKVGHSSVDVFSRVDGQTRTTALPEDPVLLRVYVTDSRSSQDEERNFHDWLEAADHGRSRSKKGGREWFLTTTKFLDRVANQRGLEIKVVAELDAGDG